MSVIEYLFCGKEIKYIESIVFIALCVIRLLLPVTNYIYIEFLFTMIIFLILPIALWWFLEKTTKLFSLSYARIRMKNVKINTSFLKLLVNEGITLLFVLGNSVIIFILSFDFGNVSFIIYYMLITLYWLCIYMLFIHVVQWFYYFLNEIKTAFISGFAFLFFLSFVTRFLSASVFQYENFAYGRVISLIVTCFILLAFSHVMFYYVTKKMGEIYDE